MALHAYPFVCYKGLLLNEVFSLAVIFKITHFQLSVQYCAKVMQVIFDEIPGFLWLFEVISFETLFR